MIDLSVVMNTVRSVLLHALDVALQRLLELVKHDSIATNAALIHPAGQSFIVHSIRSTEA